MPPNHSPFHVHEFHEDAALVVAPSPDSNSSIGGSSPTLLVPESSLDDVHSSRSSTYTPAVKFAPFPQIDPNRKRSLAPLGVSARSRYRRVVDQEGGSLWWHTDPDVPEEIVEDPVVVFAKFVKRAGKTVWRRVSKSSAVEDVS